MLNGYELMVMGKAYYKLCKSIPGFKIIKLAHRCTSMA